MRRPGGSASNWRGSGVVLVVEDEDAVRRYAMGLLTELGFTVVGAADGDQALAVVRARGAELALILLDLTLPGLSGEAVLDEIEQEETKIPIVVCSGSDPQTVRQLLAGHRVAGLLAKPYGLAQMRGTLQAALA